jgi:hypothetical protein
MKCNTVEVETKAGKINFVAHLSIIRSRDSSVGIATGYGLDDQEGREFESR